MSDKPMTFRCSARYAHNDERCQRTGDAQAIRLMVYEPGVHLGFCDDHFPDREKYRPASATMVQEACRTVGLILSGTHVLKAACRSCGLYQENRAKCECGSRDLEPVAEKIKTEAKPDPILSQTYTHDYSKDEPGSAG